MSDEGKGCVIVFFFLLFMGLIAGALFSFLFPLLAPPAVLEFYLTVIQPLLLIPTLVVLCLLVGIGLSFLLVFGSIEIWIEISWRMKQRRRAKEEAAIGRGRK